MKMHIRPVSRVAREVIFNGTLAREALQAVLGYRFL
jgi:hypothetical protein